MRSAIAEIERSSYPDPARPRMPWRPSAPATRNFFRGEWFAQNPGDRLSETPLVRYISAHGSIRPFHNTDFGNYGVCFEVVIWGFFITVFFNGGMVCGGTDGQPGSTSASATARLSGRGDGWPFPLDDITSTLDQQGHLIFNVGEAKALATAILTLWRNHDDDCDLIWDHWVDPARSISRGDASHEIRGLEVRPNGRFCYGSGLYPADAL